MKKKPTPKRQYVPSTIWPELGATGLRRVSGLVQEEFLQELRGRRGMKVYREMRDNSAVVGACLGAIDMIIRQVPWTVEPGTQDQEDLLHADLVRTGLHDMSFTWAETVAEILTMLEYGFAFHELVYKRRQGDLNDPTRRSKYSDGLIGWRKIALRSQDSLFDWDFDDEGGVQAMRQQAPPDYKMRRIPIEKALLFRAKSEKNNPEGRSVLRNAYFPWYFSKKIAEIEAIGIERDLAGLPVIWIPAECFQEGADPAQAAVKAEAERIVRDISNNEMAGLVLPMAYTAETGGQALYKFELASTMGRRQFDTTVIIERYDRRIAMTVIHDLVLMGQPNTLTYKGKGGPELFATSLSGWLDVIADVFNAHAIPRLYRLNGWPTDKCAKLKHGEVKVPDLAALGDFISKLSGASMPLFPDDALENRLRRIAELPEKPADSKAKPVQSWGAKPATPPAGGPDDTEDPPAKEDA